MPCLERAAVCNPLSSEAHHNLGVALARLRRLKEAVVSFGRALERAPDSPDALGNLGLAHLQLGNAADAIPAFRGALALRPHSAETLNNLGVALARQQEMDQAIQAYRDALRLRPDYVDALNNLGNAYRSRDQHDEALTCYREALRLNPEAAEVHNNLGITLAHLGNAEEAVAAFQGALRLRPDFAEVSNNLGVTLADSNRLHEAVAAFSDALRVRPEHAETHRNRALAWLLLGDYEQGWPEYEWRWRCENSALRPFRQPLWDGSPLEGRTILLHAEQGLGDTLQFLRYAPLVRQQGGVVVLECQPPLLRLLSNFPGADRVVPQGGPLPPFDLHVPLLSLPTVLRTTLATVPAEIPYLSADPALVDYWRRALNGLRGFKVGIAWRGSPKYGGDRARSIPLEHFAALAEVPGVQLVSLQKGPGADQVSTLPRTFPLVDLDRQLDTTGAFIDTAAVVKNLDLVITCDTAVGHLAGALGVPVWVALCCPCDWRWLRERDDSPWYPSVRLFRQRRWGDWEEVFARIAAELAVAAAGCRASETVVPVAPGELLDKLTILEIKKERVTDAGKLRNISFEHDSLAAVRDRLVPRSGELTCLSLALKATNEMLWQIEDDIRDCERAKDFGPRFVELARSVYQQNDHRAALKRQINELLGSCLIEEKSYPSYR